MIMSVEDDVQEAVSVLRRINPDRRIDALVALAKINHNVNESITDWLDRPMDVIYDEDAAKYFVACDYNRDGECYRSPWTNTYFPAPENPSEYYYPAELLRRNEITYNEIFDIYRSSYFEGGVSSVYLFDMSGVSFGAVFVTHKGLETSAIMGDGYKWDSVHVVETRSHNNQIIYKLNSTVMATFRHHGGISGDCSVGAIIRRQSEHHRKVAGDGESLNNLLAGNTESPHIMFIGRMIEEMETNIGKSIETVYVPKTQAVIQGCRNVVPTKKLVESDDEEDEEEEGGPEAGKPAEVPGLRAAVGQIAKS